MANRVNSNSLRYEINRKYQSRWFLEKKDRVNAIYADYQIRETLTKLLPPHKIGLIEIERLDNLVIITIHTSAPGLVIGKDNKRLNLLKEKVKKFIPKLNRLVINVSEVQNVNSNPELVAHSVAEQLENRVPFRIAQKQAIKRAKFAGVKGIKIIVSGRLAGADIARSETHSFGSVPLQTFRAKIGYAATTAKTTYGIIGVKVWIYDDFIDSSKQPSKSRFNKNAKWGDRKKQPYQDKRGYGNEGNKNKFRSNYSQSSNQPFKPNQSKNSSTSKTNHQKK
ncbi:30S ribosomal protein S3 [Mycoplasma sp. SG1]|uniref:30S ribosomal protein S3 n=1 Tax=Mycoplasma sp. SG1 TaxID=2810348 RepID=UPI0020247E98|nr:30S ribosomal protein S3 [Mycoplasma sp. SG1]URM52897.1 30S ribosomal protein S3 [Mycoplasma sp. SG1]